MRRRTQIDRFLRGEDGLAAMEFALIAPIMIFLFFAVVEGSDALAASRRVTLSVNTLADLVAQETSITQDSMDDLFVGVKEIVTTGGAATYRLVSVVRDPDTDEVIVHWSRDSANGTPYAAGSKYTGLKDETLLDDTSSLIVAEVEYNYSSRLTEYIISAFTMEKVATRWPRRSQRVQYCVVEGSCTV